VATQVGVGWTTRDNTTEVEEILSGDTETAMGTPTCRIAARRQGQGHVKPLLLVNCTDTLLFITAGPMTKLFALGPVEELQSLSSNL
jgi:hypothetical protein